MRSKNPAATSSLDFLDLMNGGSDNPTEINIDDIIPSDFNPRSIITTEDPFSPEKLGELSDSIRQKGIIQPLILRSKDGKYQIVAGERRYHAAKLAGLERIPALIKEIDDEEALEIAILENTQREDLTPNALAVLAIRSVARLMNIPTEQVIPAANKIKNGSEDIYGLEKHLRTLFNMSVSTFAQRYAKISLLLEPERAALVGGRFGINALIPLTKVGNIKIREDLFNQLCAGKISSEEMSHIIQGMSHTSEVGIEVKVKKLLPKFRKLSAQKKEKAEKLLQELASLLE